MRDALRPSLTFEADESPTGFASRLALLHGRTAVQLCQDLRIGFQALADGREEALARLAEIAGAPLDRLRHNAIVRTSRVTYEWRGQDLGRDNLSRLTQQVCPSCLAEDLARASRGEGHGPYGRAIWLLRYIRTCPGHHVGLVPLPGSWRTVHDFARAIRPLLDDLGRGDGHAERRTPSHLESYLLARLDGRSHPGATWLDGLGFAAAADTCETLGAVVAFGRSVLLRSLDARARHAAGDMGFSVAREGPTGIVEALRAWDAGLSDDPASGRSQISSYGAFHTFLSRMRERRPDLDPVRAVVSDHIRGTRPLAPGTMVLGERVGDRTMHSIRTAAREYGLDARLVRGFLRTTGAIGSETDASGSHAVLFDARLHGPSLEDLARSIPSAGIAPYLGASRGQASAIMRSGILPTLFDPWPPALGARRYSRTALDDFAARLHARSEEVRAPQASTYEIWNAASRARCDPMAIVRLVLDGGLPWIGCRPGRRGLASVLVRLGDLANLAQSGAARDWPLDALAGELGLDHGTLVGLIETGLLPARRAGRHDGRRAARRVSDHDLRSFLDGYVWLAQLGREWRIDPRICRKTLSALGIRPVTPAPIGGVQFFDRRDLPASPPSERRGGT